MREKMQMKTHNLGVALSTGWPMAVAMLFVTAVVLLLMPLRAGWPVILVMAAVLLLTFLACFRMYVGEYLFLPATEYKGARIIARLGRSNEVEISGVLAEEIIVKQGWIEKCLGVCHIRQKGSVVYLRGVSEPEKVRAWVAANFPKERKAEAVKPKKTKKKSAPTGRSFSLGWKEG